MRRLLAPIAALVLVLSLAPTASGVPTASVDPDDDMVTGQTFVRHDGEIDQACTFGDPVIVCSPQEENQGCADARVCSGRSTWVLPLPDGGAFAAYVEVSCGLPEGFRPCPDPADPSALVDGNALAGSATSDGGSTSDGGPEPDPLVAACECACA